MRAHIVTVINSRTRGPAPMMTGNLNDEASSNDASSDELVGRKWRLVPFGNQKQRESFHQTPARLDRRQHQRWRKRLNRLSKNVFAVGALVTSDLIAEQRLTFREDLRYLHPEEKVLEVARKKSKKHRTTCRWDYWFLGPLKCCQTTVTPKKTMLLIGIGGMQSDILQQPDPLGTERTDVCIPCKRLHSSALPSLFCVSKVGCVQSTVANHSSPVLHFQ